MSAASPGAASGAPRVWALVMAAGASRRMGDTNKLLQPLEDKPIVCHVVDALLASAVDQVVVVTGHGEAELRAALTGRQVRFVHNGAHAEGLSTSLRQGLSALPSHVEGALICLGDMPSVRSEHVDALVGAFRPTEQRDICAPYHGGRRGNPILWPARCFAEMRALDGDVGARALLAAQPERICQVELADDAIHVDVDSFDELEELRALTARKR